LVAARKSGLHQLLELRDGRIAPDALDRGLGKVSETQFYEQLVDVFLGAAALDPSLQAVVEFGDQGQAGCQVRNVGRVGFLDADRLALLRARHLPAIDAAAQVVQASAEAAEVVLQFHQGPAAQVGAGLGAQLVQLGRGDLTHAEQLLDRQRGDEGIDLVRADQ
jgi:hypothetical protein